VQHIELGGFGPGCRKEDDAGWAIIQESAVGPELQASDAARSSSTRCLSRADEIAAPRRSKVSIFPSAVAATFRWTKGRDMGIYDCRLLIEEKSALNTTVTKEHEGFWIPSLVSLVSFVSNCFASYHGVNYPIAICLANRLKSKI
jgi:hypothetical protein